MTIQVEGFSRYTAQSEPNKLTVLSGTHFQKMMNQLSQARILCFDFETTGTAYYHRARPCGVALGTVDDQGRTWNWYVPWSHQTGEQQLDISMVGDAIGQLLGNPYSLKVAHNIKFDDHMARTMGWKVAGYRHDTMIGARFRDENRGAALKYRAETDLGHPGARTMEREISRYVRKVAKMYGYKRQEYLSKFGYAHVPVLVGGRYACYDTDFTLQLYQLDMLKGIHTQYSRVYATEMELTEYLCDMEENGMLIDVPYLHDLRRSLTGVRAGLQSRIFHNLGYTLNLSADAEVRDLLLNKLGVTLTKRTKKGNAWAVDREVLDSFTPLHPILGLISEWRDVNKIITTYTKSVLDKLDRDGYLHGDFQQVGTDTGRLSCREPNLQNFYADSNDRAKEYSGKPLKDGGVDPWSVRRAFINRGSGWVRLFFDYSQIELRVLAYYSQDPILVDSYLKGEDVHTRTSLEVFGTDDPAKRRDAKVINFGLSYSMSPIGFARQTGCTSREAEDYFKKFFTKYSGIKSFRKCFWTQVVRQRGEFQNLFGRPRRVPSILKMDYEARRGERMAIASLIQGTAAELTKESIVRIGRWLRETGTPAKLVSTVHDEVQLDVPIDYMAVTAAKIKQLMEDFPEFDPIPVIVDGDYSTTSWADKKSLC